jgi:MraZ protein
MTTFIGDYHCKVDSKGRIMLPAAFKKQMPSSASDRFVIKKDIFERCLVLYPMDEWDRQNAIIRSKINPYNKEHNTFLRGFFKGTAEIVLDSNNRILIPKRLLDSVIGESEVVMAGQGGRIEIWSVKLYESVADNADEFATLAEKILGATELNH